MEIKVLGKSGMLNTDPHKVPSMLLRKYPEAHWRFVSLTPKAIRKRLDQGYQFVPAKEVGSFQGRVGRMVTEIGVPEDVFLVGDTVLMVCHKKDAEMRQEEIEKVINSRRKAVKTQMLEGVKDIDGRVGVIGTGITKDSKENTAKQAQLIAREAELNAREAEIKEKENRHKAN